MDLLSGDVLLGFFLAVVVFLVATLVKKLVGLLGRKQAAMQHPKMLGIPQQTEKLIPRNVGNENGTPGWCGV